MSLANHALAGMVRDRLSCDRRVAAQMIDVDCAEGCVSLVGCVDTAEQKAMAVHLVSGLIGVTSVKDELVVRGFASAGS